MVRRAPDVANLLVAERAQVVHHEQRAAVLVGVDRGAARVRVHGDEHRVEPGERRVLLEVLGQDVEVDDGPVDWQLPQPARGVGDRVGRHLGPHLDHRDGEALLARGHHHTLEHGQVTHLRHVEGAEPHCAVAPVTQRPTCVVGPKPQPGDGVVHALSREVAHVGLAVHHARDRLLGDARLARDVGHRGGAARLAGSLRPRARYPCHGTAPLFCRYPYLPAHIYERSKAAPAHAPQAGPYRPPRAPKPAESSASPQPRALQRRHEPALGGTPRFVPLEHARVL